MKVIILMDSLSVFVIFLSTMFFNLNFKKYIDWLPCGYFSLRINLISVTIYLGVNYFGAKLLWFIFMSLKMFLWFYSSNIWLTSLYMGVYFLLAVYHWIYDVLHYGKLWFYFEFEFNIIVFVKLKIQVMKHHDDVYQ